MKELKNWLSYWKNSLADAERAEIDFQRQKHFTCENLDLSKGQLPKEDIRVLFEIEEKKLNEQKGITKPDSPHWVTIDALELLVAPFVLQPLPEYQKFLRSTKPVFPFWVKAIASPNGHLEVTEEHFPVIPRSVLAPLADEDNDFIFSHVDTVDKATTLDKSEFEDWAAYWEFTLQVFEQITDQSLASYEQEYYRKVDRILYFVPDEKFMPSTHIIKLLENLLINESAPSLIKQVTHAPNRKDKKPLTAGQYMETNSLHLGQMGCDYPLSISQRKALYTFLNAKEEKVFAVNGPPGTGKTTLLQSVVANYVVQSVKQDEPPVILACSTNNQAVTNIIESFSKSSSNLPVLGQRWISAVEGFAAFLPSNAKQILPGINYYKSDDSSNLSSIDDYENVEKYESEFLDQINGYVEKNFVDLTSCCEYLKKEILSIETTFNKGKTVWNRFLKQLEQFNNVYEIEPSTPEYYLDAHTLNIKQLASDIESLTEMENRVITYFNSEPVLRKFFCWLNLKFSLDKRKEEVRRIIRNAPFKFQDESVYNRSLILHEIDNKILLLKTTIEASKSWSQWKAVNHIQGNPPTSDDALAIKEASKTKATGFSPNYFYDELDVTLRHKAFWLSIHYWEAKWILATQETNNGDRKENKGVEGRMNLWKRRAMLTPCFVSTFFMAPRFFTYSKHMGKSDANGNLWESPPLEEFVDLLLVDESGQVTPEVGVPTFALCKKALVVGDVKQIEPVWSIIPKVDKGNLVKHGIITSSKDTQYSEYLRKKGLLASGGNMMSVAQSATNFVYDDPRVTERGMMLQEHRRCYNEIIKYCNDMAYAGVLKPMRGKSNGSLLPPMYHFHVDSNSITKNKDRTNEKEAEVLLNWLIQYRDKIFDHYSDVEEYKKQFENMVGIITPFSGQKRTLIRLAKGKGLNTKLMKIGTVHALQGAERPVILFSSVYGPGDTGTMFFDRENKPNMLNVAVSRAKDSFIVFGNRKILDPKSSRPSGMLAKHLKFHEN